MQILKEDLKVAILQAAEYEFLKHGYKGASMRSIAKRGHTTLGNMYHYFESKEILYESLVGDLKISIEELIKVHEANDIKQHQLQSIGQVDHLLEQADFDTLGQHLFLSKRFAILMEGSRGTKYEGYKEELLKLMSAHIGTHLGNNEKLARMFAISFMEGMLFVAKTSSNVEEGKKAFKKYVTILIQGIMSYKK